MRSARIVWLVLVAATCVSLAVSLEQTASTTAWVTTILLFVAFFKVRLVGQYFMGIRTAPRSMRTAFDAYIAASFCALAAISWLS